MLNIELFIILSVFNLFRFQKRTGILFTLFIYTKCVPKM